MRSIVGAAIHLTYYYYSIALLLGLATRVISIMELRSNNLYVMLLLWQDHVHFLYYFIVMMSGNEIKRGG